MGRPSRGRFSPRERFLDPAFLIDLHHIGHVSIRRLADYTGLDRKTVSRIIHGQPVSKKTLARLRNISIDQLLIRAGMADPKKRQQLEGALRFLEAQKVLRKAILDMFYAAWAGQEPWEEFKKFYEIQFLGG